MRLLLDALREQPPQSRRTLGLVLGGAGVVTAALAALAMRPASGDVCGEGPTAMDAAWGSARADAIRAGFAAQPRQDAKVTGGFVVTALDDYAQRWRAQRSDACAANQVRHDESDLLYGRRLVCLEGRLAAFDALAETLTTPTPFAVERGTRLVGQLPALELCGDAKYLMADVAPPDTPELVEEVAAIRSAGQAILARARQLDARTASESAALTERARATGYEPVLAYALVNEADVDAQLHGTRRESERRAFEGLLSAELAGDDRLVLDALLLMADYDVRESHIGTALDRLARADVVLQRLGDPTVLRLAWLKLRGKTAHASLDAESALQYLERAREIRQETGSWESVWAIVDEQHLAQAYTSIGRLDEARQSLEHALELSQVHLGPKHSAVASNYLLLGNLELGLARPEVALAHYDRAEEIGTSAVEDNLAYVRFQRAKAKYLVGDMAAAEAKMREAIELSRKGRGEDHNNTAAFRANLGNFLLQRGRPAEALALLERSRDTFASKAGDEHPTMQLTNARLGDYYRAIDDKETAAALYRRVTTISADARDDDARRLALTGLGELAMQEDRNDDAVILLEEAVALNAPQDFERQHAFAQFALARALQRSGAKGTRARTLAEAAHESFTDMATQPEALARVEQWLAANPIGPG